MVAKGSIKGKQKRPDSTLAEVSIMGIMKPMTISTAANTQNSASADPKVVAGVMDELLKARQKPFLKTGDVANGFVIIKEGARVYLDLGIYGTGIIFGKEYQNARELVKNAKPGDHLAGKVVDVENEDGYIELSLKEAGEEVAWKEIKELKEGGEPMDLKILDSNKGGLVLELKGVKGFLPASQLSAAHYPRVEGGDKEKISDELKKLVGQTIGVTVLDFDIKAQKLIFSEKGAGSEDVKKIVEKYKVGDVVEGEVTGVVEFGIFIKIEEGLEGLAHISELDWALVEAPSHLFKIGDRAKAKIIAIEGDKISLSVKALKPDPWEVNKDQHKKGDIVEGKVLRINKFGALVLLPTGIYGLTHISEFGSEAQMREVVEVGKSYFFQILVFQPENRKLSLSFLGKDGQSPLVKKADAEPKPKAEKKAAK